MLIRSVERSGSNELAEGEVSQKVGSKWRNFGNLGMERIPIRCTPNENLFRLPRAGEMVYTSSHFLKSKGDSCWIRARCLSHCCRFRCLYFWQQRHCMRLQTIPKPLEKRRRSFPMHREM